MFSKRIWCIRAGSVGQADGIFLKKNQVAVGSSEVLADASALPPARAAFKEAVARVNPNASPAAIPIGAGQLYRFVHEMGIGDYVVYPRKNDRTLHWGEIVGPYVYDCAGGDYGEEFAHRRGVRWLGRRSRDDFTPGALYELGSALALFEIKSFAEELFHKFSDGGALVDLRGPSVEKDSAEAQREVFRDVEETTKDFISKCLKTSLKGYAMEGFVADLFRAMGYRARATQPMRDEGVDVIAHRDELGIEPPIIKIQVKTREAHANAESVKAFYACVHDREVGVFISTGAYTAAARDFARAKANLKLIDGVAFIELIQKHYDDLDWKYRRLIPLRRVLVPVIEKDEPASYPRRREGALEEFSAGAAAQA